jgi:Protein of unknown function (DUF1203)
MGMHRYRVIAMEEDVAAGVRTTRVAPDYGHPAHAEVAADPAPCRVCLDRFAPGAERRLLFTYDPFRDTVDLPLPGPIFIHEDECRPYDAGAGFPPALRDAPLTFNAYGADRALVARERTEGAGEVDAAIGRLLGDDDVDYVHVRSTTAGCFLCRLDRTAA